MFFSVVSVSFQCHKNCQCDFQCHNFIVYAGPKIRFRASKAILPNFKRAPRQRRTNYLGTKINGSILKTFSLKWAEKIPLFQLCMLEIFVCTMTSSPCLHEHHYTHTDVHTNCSRTLHARTISDPIFLGKPNWKCKNAVPFLSTYELESYIKWKYIFSSLIYNAKIFCITNQRFLLAIYTLRPR